MISDGQLQYWAAFGTAAVAAIAVFAAVRKALPWCGRTLVAVLRFPANALDLAAKVREAAEAIIGNPDNPGVIDRLDRVERRQVQIEKEMHPNGGGSLRDDVQRCLSIAEQSVEQAKQARLAASDAHDQAQELSTRMWESSELNMRAHETLVSRVDEVERNLLSVSVRTREDYPQRDDPATGPAA